MKLLITSIGRRGYFADFFKKSDSNIVIYGTSNSELTPGFEYCDKTFIVPDIVDEHYVDAILKICLDEKIDAIMSLFDLDISILAARRSEFVSMGIRTFLTYDESSEIAFDKFKTYKFCVENNIKTPRTYIELDEVREDLLNSVIEFPLFIKPRRGFASNSIFKVKNMEMLEVIFNNEKDMIIQEGCKGIEHSFDMLYNLEGDLVRVFCKKKIQMRAGETDQAETVYDQSILNIGEKIGALYKNVGPLDIDFFLQENGDYQLLEFNPRFGGGYPISHHVGADYPKLMLEMCKEGDIKFERCNYSSGVIMMKEYGFIFKD